MLSLSVFIFAYNEAKSLEAVVKEITDTLKDTNCPYEVVIIDDGSSDGSGEIADRLTKEIIGVSAIHHERNFGLGSAYKTAFAKARCDLVTFFSGDSQFSPQIIKRFLPLMEKWDMVLGYLPNRNDSALSRLLSKAEKIVFRILFGPIPNFQGVLMFRRKLLDEIELRSDGGRAWTVLLELIIRAARSGYRITSVPIEMRPRMCGRSKVNNLPTIWANLRQAFILRRYI